MELYYRTDDTQGWQSGGAPLVALSRMPDECRKVLLRVTWPILEEQRTVAAVKLVRRLCPPGAELLVATPYPTRHWLATVRRAGADGLVLCPPSPDGNWRGPASHCRPLTEGQCCPGLELRVRRNSPIAVCRYGAMPSLLPAGRIATRCACSFADCPQWREHESL